MPEAGADGGAAGDPAPDGAGSSGAGGSRAESIAKWVTILGSVVAVGQTCSSAVTGYWQSRIEQTKSEQDIKLQELKDRSELAKSYLELITGSQAQTQDRIMLLGALSEVEGHPLQKWAAARYKLYQGMVEQMLKAARDGAAAGQIVNESESESARLTADINELVARIAYYRDDPQKLEELRTELREKSERMGVVKAKLSLASVKAAALAVADPASRQPLELQVSKIEDPSIKIVDLSERVTPEILYPLFPASAKPLIDANLVFFRKALQEFKVSDRRVLAVILATISIETPRFDAYEESVEAAKAYEGRTALGNTEPGDGVLFRGRGYIGITGRANYRRMSERLGLGSRLVDFPDDAKSPEVASRIAVVYFTDRNARIVAALDEEDFAALRRVVTGGTGKVDLLVSRYNTLLAKLP